MRTHTHKHTQTDKLKLTTGATQEAWWWQCAAYVAAPTPFLAITVTAKRGSSEQEWNVTRLRNGERAHDESTLSAGERRAARRRDVRGGGHPIIDWRTRCNLLLPNLIFSDGGYAAGVHPRFASVRRRSSRLRSPPPHWPCHAVAQVTSNESSVHLSQTRRDGNEATAATGVESKEYSWDERTG